MASQAIDREPTQDLQVLQNLHCGRSRLRLLDVKIGQKSAPQLHFVMGNYKEATYKYIYTYI